MMDCRHRLDLKIYRSGKFLYLLLLLVMLMVGCGIKKIPERTINYQEPKDVMRSYYDYRGLEQAGIEAVRLKSQLYNRTVSLPYYLFTIAQAFEKFGRDQDATKLYLRLLMNYPLINEGEQLGINAENRLKWLIGNKEWIYSSVDEMIFQLDRAILNRDEQALKNLISRDFCFGRTKTERFAVQYQEGLKLIANGFEKLTNPVIEIIENFDDKRVVLKSTGWDQGNKIWYFALHKNERVQGWEWDLAYWEQLE